MVNSSTQHLHCIDHDGCCSCACPVTQETEPTCTGTDKLSVIEPTMKVLLKKLSHISPRSSGAGARQQRNQIPIRTKSGNCTYGITLLDLRLISQRNIQSCRVNHFVNSPAARTNLCMISYFPYISCFYCCSCSFAASSVLLSNCNSLHRFPRRTGSGFLRYGYLLARAKTPFAGCRMLSAFHL